MSPKINKSFILGVVAGIGGYITVKELNKSLKPFAVKTIEKALILGDKTKEFVDDVKGEVVKNRNIINDISNDDDILDHCAVTSHGSYQEEVVKLQQQLIELEDKMKKLNIK